MICDNCKYRSSGGQTIVCQYYGPLEINPYGNCVAFEPVSQPTPAAPDTAERSTTFTPYKREDLFPPD